MTAAATGAPLLFVTAPVNVPRRSDSVTRSSVPGDELGRFIGDVATAVKDALNVPARPSLGAQQHRAKEVFEREGPVVLHLDRRTLTGAGAANRLDSKRDQRAGGRCIEDDLALDVDGAPERHQHAVHVRD